MERNEGIDRMDTAGEYDMTDLLTLLIAERAEGLSVTPGQPPAIHVRGWGACHRGAMRFAGKPRVVASELGRHPTDARASAAWHSRVRIQVS